MFLGSIIPHAGEKYAGECRKELFIKINNTINNTINNKDRRKDRENIIIYISALHNPILRTNKVLIYADNEYIYRDFIHDSNVNSRKMISKKSRRKSRKRTKIDHLQFMMTNIHHEEKEHSYIWVENELNHNFKNIKGIIVLTPSNLTDNKLLAQKIYNYSRQRRKKYNILVFATTDLIHYGPRFSETRSILQRPYLHDKIVKEERIIECMKKKDIDGFNANANSNILCGFHAIKTFLFLSSLAKWSGEVCDYYDSHMIKLSRKMQEPMLKYCIDFDFGEKDTFVSYVSIFYSNKHHRTNINSSNNISPIDIKLALGLLRNYITFQTNNYKHILPDLRLPIWSNFYNISNGIFVGTDIDGKTNCSKGNFETGNSLSAINISNASKTCIEDANNRWRRPYIRTLLSKYTYKIEVLQTAKYWHIVKPYKLDKILSTHDSRLNTNIGVYLTLKSGHSATYLPVVAAENPLWSVDKYMNSLANKAYPGSGFGTGSGNMDWREMSKSIKVYKSVAYYWSPKAPNFHTTMEDLNI